MLLQMIDCNVVKMQLIRDNLIQNNIISCMVYMIGNDMIFDRQCRVDYRDRPTFD